MDEMENIQEQPEFEPVAETDDFQPEMPVYEEYPEVTQQEILPEEKPKKKKRGAKFFFMALSCLLALAIVVVGSGAAVIFLHMHWGDEIKRNEQIIHQMQQTIDELREEIKDNSFTGNGNSVSGTPNENAEGLTPGQVYAQSVDSIVTVSATVRGTMGQQGTSTGSGFVITEDGYVVTNYHVVEGATAVAVTLHSGMEHTAEVIGYDDANDVAVLKIEAQGLQFLKAGSSDDLIVGDQVVAIGNPLGELTSTMTVGYVSAKDRVISTDGSLINMIQTDAAINSGNSGGPLLNMKGEVVGITTAKYSGTTSSGASIEGISFAVPMDDVWKKITDLRDFGYITGAALGVMVRDVDQQTAVYYGLPMGAYVAEVNAGGAAEKAGVQARDIIVAIGENQVTSLNELTRVLEQYNGGEATTITVWRAGREVTLKITLDTRTPDF
ncbi:MAG: trypsin-like peptidase domain-containing protein [Oscillospiraceae bacterium]|nr:trypsin-like peptidase domain-containing protein [Oscillospiraceae bacterium]